MSKPFEPPVNNGAQDLLKQRSFVQVVRTGGISSAARLLGLTPSAVSKNIARLEAELKVQLLSRDNRRLTPTERGMHAFAVYGELLASLDQLHQELATSTDIAGQLGLSIPGGTLPWLAPLLHRFGAMYPLVQLRLNVSDSHTDFVRDRMDIALRFGPLKDRHVKAMRLAATPLILCAAPGYLARAGVPASPGDLAAHSGLLFRLPGSGRARPVELEPPSPSPGWRACAVVDDGQALVQAALAGLGLIQAPRLLVEADLAAGRLVELLAAHRPPELEVNLLFAATPWLSPQTRAMIDLARDMLGQA